MESARRASPADLDRISELAARAAVEVRAQRGGELHLGGLRPFEPADISRADTVVYVGNLDDVVVGYAVARLRPAGSDGLIATIDALYVEPAAREVGVGEAMMDELLAWCVAERCSGVDAVALPGDRATKNFFERYGLTARAIVVHRSFEPES